MVSRKAGLAGGIFAGLVIGMAIAHSQAIPDLGFTTKVSTALVAQYRQKFGSPVPDRVSEWTKIAKDLKAAGYAGRLEKAKGREADVLQDVNEAINRRIRGILDKDHWGVEDYWATPAESISTAGGDCEDFSIAKYYLLKELGVPIERLRITYVRLLRMGGAAHMVLAYYPTPESEPLILDNMDGHVRAGSDRSDLDPVYGFNDDFIQMVKTGQRGKPAQIRAWLVMQEHLLAESRT